jgi:hypothetical protein
MSRPLPGTSAGDLSLSLLPWIEQPEHLEQLRALLGHFTHRCRNSLQGIKMGLYLCKRANGGTLPESWAKLEANYADIEQLFDRLQAIYRPLRATMVRSALGELFTGRLPLWRSWFAERGGALDVAHPGEETVGEFDPLHLGAALDALVLWRREARPRSRLVRLSWGISRGFFEVRWQEFHAGDQCAVEHGDDAAFVRAPTDRGVDTLALPLLVRVASAHQGRVESTADPALCLTLIWPQFQTR